MPDKHEVGGSSPLEPTKAADSGEAKENEEKQVLQRSLSDEAERDSEST